MKCMSFRLKIDVISIIITQRPWSFFNDFTIFFIGTSNKIWLELLFKCPNYPKYNIILSRIFFLCHVSRKMSYLSLFKFHHDLLSLKPFYVIEITTSIVYFKRVKLARLYLTKALFIDILLSNSP